MGFEGNEFDGIPLQDQKRPSLFAKRGDNNITLNHFEIKSVIGRGTYGKVFLIERKSNSGEFYAMKSLDKQTILDSGEFDATKLEKEVLMQADHPFLVGMSYVFQTENKILFVIRFVRGGELFTRLRRV